MRHTAVVILATLTALCGEGADDNKKSPQNSARVVVSGKSVGQVLVKVSAGGETKKLQVVLVELDDKTKVAVARPKGPADPPAKEDKSGVDPDLKRLLEAAQEKDIAAEGRLSSTDNDVVIAAVGSKGTKSVPLLIADRVTDLTAENAKDFPPRGSIWVEGLLTKATTKVDRYSTDWTISNEDPNPLPVMVPEGVRIPEAGSRVRATGSAKVVKGRLVVEVKRLEAIK